MAKRITLLLTFLLLSLSLTLGFSSSASAFNYGTAGWVSLNGGWVQSKDSNLGFNQFLFGIDTSANATYKQKLRAVVTSPNSGVAQEIERIRLTYPSGYYNPQKSIAHFSIRFQSLTTNNELGYMGFTPVFSDYTGDSSSGSVGSLLGSSCTVLRYVNGTYSGDIQCDYYVYYDYVPTEFNFNGYVFFPGGVTGVIDVEPTVDYIAITDVQAGDISSLEADLTTVINNLNTVISNQNIIGDELRTIESVMRLIRNGQTTPSQIEAAVSDAIQSERESEQTQYEDQAEENEQTVEDNSSAAQSTATTLLGVVGQFISVLTSAQPTNCNLNGDLIPHLPLGNLNLCQNSPPAAITALGSLLLIAFVVPLAYHTVKRMLALIGSFQS